MRERIKRRKKTSAEGKAEPAPAPLQPAFYDTSPANVVAPVQAETTPPPPPAEMATEAGSEEIPSQSPPQREEGDARQRRRRRSRGGRGRSRKPGGKGVAASPGSGRPVHMPPAEAHEQPGSFAAEPPGADTPAAPHRPSKGVVVLAIGLPGSGKSSWFKRHNITPLSSDLLRALLFDDPTEQRFQDLIFSNLRSLLKARLIARRPLNYVDATNLTPHERQGWIKLAKDYGYEVQAVFFDVPVETCLERNRRRERVVPDDVMHRMAGKLKPPTFEEGFSKITMVRVKAKEG